MAPQVLQLLLGEDPMRPSELPESTGWGCNVTWKHGGFLFMTLPYRIRLPCLLSVVTNIGAPQGQWNETYSRGVDLRESAQQRHDNKHNITANQ